MTRERNPQAEQMGDESMARNLAHQANAIWPQEQALFARYGLSGSLRILDLGCGTGEISRRLALLYPQAEVLGIDILEGNLAIAERESRTLASRLRYLKGDAFALQLDSASFDLVVCRHMSQSVPDFPLALTEMTRVLRTGGRLHLLSEDYGMLHLPVIDPDPDDLWHDIVFAFFRATRCDGRIGRHSWTLLRSAGCAEVTVDYVTVDPLRTERRDFVGIMRAWRDGYVDILADSSGRDRNEVRRRFDAIVASAEDPDKYYVWQVPVIAGRKT